VTHAASHFGRLDIMVNNAGIFPGLHTMLDESEEVFDSAMAVNAKGVWLCCKYAIVQMLTQEPLETASRGKIVNIASVAALIGLGQHPAYSASKAGVVNLTRQLAVTYGPRRINVNAVCPGLIPTAMTRPTNAETEEWHRRAFYSLMYPSVLKGWLKMK
jgi:NAD(P)-dependent dehydrogenase (short-subunit alcohol dehydrogenase family)